MSEPAILIASAKLRPGEDRAFSDWQVRHNAAIGKSPGFISSDVMPPSQAGSNEWTIVLNFRWFGWWLFTEKKTPPWITPVGLGFLAALFAVEVGALWHLLPW